MADARGAIQIKVVRSGLARGHRAAQRTVGRAYIELGQPQQAIPHLKAALPIDDDGNLHYLMARAYQTSGQADLAKAMLKDYQGIVKSAAAANQAAERQVQIAPP